MSNETNLSIWANANREMIEKVGTKKQRKILAQALQSKQQEQSIPPTKQRTAMQVPAQQPAPLPITQPARPTATRQLQIEPIAQAPSLQKAPTPQPQPTNRTIVTGDSVATGIGYGGAKGDPRTDAAWGRGSAEQLTFMQKKGAKYYKGSNVVLSSGVLNSGDLVSVEEQLKFLLKSGASSIRLAGAPLTGRLSRLNPQLKALAQKYGISFIGPYASQDGVHPDTYTNYK